MHDSSASSFPDIISQKQLQQESSQHNNTNTPPADDYCSPDHNTSAAAAAATAESIDNLLANLAEDNANSLPSADGDNNSIALRAMQSQQQQRLPDCSSGGELVSQHPNGTSTSTVEFLSGQLAERKGGDAERHTTIETTNTTDTTETSPRSSSDADGNMDDDDDNDDEEAIACDPPNHQQSNDSQATLADADMVSEDELISSQPMVEERTGAAAVPVASSGGGGNSVQPVTVDDAEEVSDEELPGPRLAELPADTEVVSEDELPASNKAKRKAQDDDYDPGSQTDENNDGEVLPEKRLRTNAQQKLSAPIDGKETDTKVQPVQDGGGTKVEKKVLPELEKYWKAVRDDPDDFTGWTYLLQYVDQEVSVKRVYIRYKNITIPQPYRTTSKPRDPLTMRSLATILTAMATGASMLITKNARVTRTNARR